MLSEIDPAFNADPAGFDMRSFSPAYRLINGKPFPSSDPVPTDQGHPCCCATSTPASRHTR